MLLKIKRDTLLKPITLIMGFVEKKQTMPILANIYIKKIGNQITIIANDLEIQASISIGGEMEGEDFTITIPAKKLQEVLKAFPDDSNLTFVNQGSRILVKSGKIKFTLQYLPADHYPLLKIMDGAVCQFKIEQNKFKTLISQVQYAMANKDSRVFLNGMYFEITNNQLRLIATDAHILAYASTDLSEPIINHAAIIPHKTITELYRLLADTPELVTVRFYPTQVVFETPDKQLITKLIDGKYPNYERVIPTNNDKLCLINRQLLLESVDRVGVIGFEKLKTLNFELENNTLKISCKNQEQDESRDEIEVVYQNESPLTISFNIFFLRELLSHCQAELLQWAFFNEKRSVLVTIPNENNFKAVIMPLGS